MSAKLRKSDEMTKERAKKLALEAVGLSRLYGLIRCLPINPTCPVHSIPVLPVFAGTIHLFLDAAFLDEVTLLPFNEATNKHVASM